jgi:hypothetical protein
MKSSAFGVIINNTTMLAIKFHEAFNVNSHGLKRTDSLDPRKLDAPLAQCFSADINHLTSPLVHIHDRTAYTKNKPKLSLPWISAPLL